MILGLPYFHTGGNTNKYLFPSAGEIHCSCHCQPLLVDRHVNLFLDSGEESGRKEPKFEAEKNVLSCATEVSFREIFIYCLLKGQYAVQ